MCVCVCPREQRVCVRMRVCVRVCARVFACDRPPHVRPSPSQPPPPPPRASTPPPLAARLPPLWQRHAATASAAPHAHAANAVAALAAATGDNDNAGRSPNVPVPNVFKGRLTQYRPPAADSTCDNNNYYCYNIFWPCANNSTHASISPDNSLLFFFVRPSDYRNVSVVCPRQRVP